MTAPTSKKSPQVWNSAAAAHLLSRAAFGATPEEARRLAAMPMAKAVDSLIDAATRTAAPEQPKWVRDPWINTERVWADTTDEQRRENHRATGRRQRDETEDLRAWWLNQMIKTEGPLQETMTLFWHGHFTSAYNKVFMSQPLYHQNAQFRRHALGNFRALLGATLTDGAMMLYLDMEDSDKKQPNENLARELCELFTLGDGNYKEKDVREIARALTGWTLDAPPGADIPRGKEGPPTFRGSKRDGIVAKFIPERHDDGEKTILGQTGKFGVEEVADILAAQPATARMAAKKLIHFFGAIDPQGALQKRMADTFTANAKSEIQMAEVLRVLLTAPEFYAAEARGAQIKSPVRLLVGACRHLKLEVEPTPNLAYYVGAMGQHLFDPPNVKGWPGGRNWLNAGTMATRMHIGEVLLDSEQLAGLEPLGRQRFAPLSRDEEKAKQTMAAVADFDAEGRAKRNALGVKCRFNPNLLFAQGVPDRPAALVDALLARLLARPAQSATRETLLQLVIATPPAARVTEAVRLILAAPEYQMA
jgi:uncharacterized protein (DUF1800 family)